jgi:threonine/homoserine efflux transporter RhtA
MSLALIVAACVTKPLGFTAIPIIMLTLDIVLAGLGVYLCETELSHFQLRDLARIFDVSLYKSYLDKITSLTRSARNV